MLQSQHNVISIEIFCKIFRKSHACDKSSPLDQYTVQYVTDKCCFQQKFPRLGPMEGPSHCQNIAGLSAWSWHLVIGSVHKAISKLCSERLLVDKNCFILTTSQVGCLPIVQGCWCGGLGKHSMVLKGCPGMFLLSPLGSDHIPHILPSWCVTTHTPLSSTEVGDPWRNIYGSL